MLDKIKIIHNENALKAVIYKEKDKNIQTLLIEYMSYMHSDSLLFLSKIFIFIKNNDISPWVRGEVAESLLKLDLPNNEGISEILKDVICNKSINSKTKSDIAKRIFTFRKDKEFTQEIIAIINNESMSSWVRGALVSALPSFDKVKNVELIFDFMFNSQINHLVKEDIARDIMPMLLQFKEYHERVFMSIIDIIKNHNIDFRLKYTLSLYLSNILYFDKQKIETLINVLDDPKIHILLRFNIARTLIILKVKDKRFLSILKILIKDKNIKFNDVRELFQFLSAYNNLDKEYRKVLDIVRSKSPKYIKIKNRFMKMSKYKEALAKGIRY